MSQLPVILLSNANNARQPSLITKEEGKRILNHLTSSVADAFFCIYADFSGSKERLEYLLSSQENSIAILHIASHALEKDISELEAEQLAKSVLSKLNGIQQLNLVFLSGFATPALIRGFLKKGIPAVIGSVAPSGDNKSAAFADQFYYFLAQDYTIKQAFLLAAAILESKTGIQAKIFAENNYYGDTSWGLIYRDEQVLNWELPKFSALSLEAITALSVPFMPMRPPNAFLIEKLQEGLSPFFPQLKAFGDHDDKRQLSFALLECLPKVAREQFRKLLARDKFEDGQWGFQSGMERLHQLIYFYLLINELMIFGLLSKMRNLVAKSGFKLQEDLKSEINSFLLLDSHSRQKQNLNDIVKKLACALKQGDHKTILKIQEFQSLFYEDESFLVSVAFLEKIKNEIYSREDSAFVSIHEVCLKTEAQLGIFISKSGSLLADIKNREDQLGPFIFERPVDNTTSKPKWYMLSHFDKAKNKLMYKDWADRKFQNLIPEERFPPLTNNFSDLFRLLFG